MATLPVFIPLSEAARKYGLDEAYLRQMVERGKIRAAMVAGEMVVSEEEVRKAVVTRKEDLPEYKKYEHLRGNSIWILKAAENYEVPFSTLRGWVKKGYIRIIGQRGKKVLLDEQDVAYCSGIYHQRRGQGKWIFEENGIPYKPKTDILSL